MCPVLMQALKKSIKRMSDQDKVVALMFDEVYLNKGFYYNKRGQRVDGFEDYGNGRKTDKVADHALVFMVQGLKRKSTMPVALYFVHKTCHYQMLKALIQQVLGSLFDLGLTVLATISDQGPTNRDAINLLKNSSVDDVCYAVLGQRLVHIFDTPHILKNVRNNLITSDLEFDGNKVAEWSNLIEFFKLDESSFNMSSLTNI